MKKLFSTLIILILITCSFGSASAFNEMSVNTNKYFTVTFNQEFDSETVNDETVYVTDINGDKLNSISFTYEAKKLYVSNTIPYKEGQKYYLHITEDVKSAKGHTLNKGAILQFSVYKGDFEIESVDPDVNDYINNLENKIKELEEKLAKYEAIENNNSTNEFQPLSQTIDGVTVRLNKVEQDSDSLRLYVTYINNTNDEILTGDSLAKVVANNKQYTYNHDFNFPRYYKTGVPKAETFIEPGVHEDSVIFFSPVSSNTINIVLGAGWDDFRFNNVPIIK